MGKIQHFLLKIFKFIFGLVMGQIRGVCSYLYDNGHTYFSHNAVVCWIISKDHYLSIVQGKSWVWSFLPIFIFGSDNRSKHLAHWIGSTVIMKSCSKSFRPEPPIDSAIIILIIFKLLTSIKLIIYDVK